MYWRWRILSAKLLSLIFFHILNRQSGSKGWNLSRHRLLIMLVQAEKELYFLHKSCMFKLQIPIDRHNPILIPNQCCLSDPPHTFNAFVAYGTDSKDNKTSIVCSVLLIFVPCPWIMTHNLFISFSTICAYQRQSQSVLWYWSSLYSISHLKSGIVYLKTVRLHVVSTAQSALASLSQIHIDTQHLPPCPVDSSAKKHTESDTVKNFFLDLLFASFRPNLL